ncbi:mannose-binding protein [Mycobacterium sp. ACS1612]|uniref:LysM peptidoglycan-binding domain-containing protein n=1 Tax=Mycobacterium sp. ACS1612 TaxID=1834117 RepID=UPI0008008192|nr:LysM peptidoglycan-binding domain-containing protein [Mycobacterium sp. ACS1612]OBF35851.1 mannose-binding protein [Mycobacterium sp. ACS1612]
MGAKYQVQSGDTLWALAQRYYGDGRLCTVISVVNDIADPDNIVVGQELEIPYVTFRYQVQSGDTKGNLAQKFYNDVAMSEVYEIPNGAAQRDLVVGEWLLIPDLGNVGHHTVVASETLPTLAQRWYGEDHLWPIISIANQLPDGDPAPGTVLIQPRLNRKHTVAAGDTLWKLAEDNYGDGGAARTLTLVKMVAAANFIDDPDVITVGQVIRFPSFELSG